jgi:putative heme-binding domain-containing protein
LEDAVIRIRNALLALLAPLALAESPSAADIEAGRRVFQEACSACHGQNGGGGHGPALADGRRVRGLDDGQLLQAIRKGVPGTDMPPSPLAETQLKQVVSFLRNLSAPAIDAAAPGDPQAGRDIFFGKAGCTHCHAIRGNGGFLGPDLTDIGASRTLSQLRAALLEPNKRRIEGFEPVIVTMADGRRFEGIARNHDNYSIQVLDTSGRLQLLSVADTAKIELRRSLMPDDFARRLSPEEIRDLLAFLSRQATHGEGKQ